MTVQIPEFKKCCICLPLRRGLLAWGYTKLVAELFIIPYLGLSILMGMVSIGMAGDRTIVPTIIAYNITILCCLILSITDFVATIVFIIGGHKKNLKLIRGFYIFSIGDLIVTTLLSLVLVSVLIVLAQKSRHFQYMLYGFLLELLLKCGIYFGVFVVKGYFILLLRSEVIKLKSSGQFRFVNNSAEAEAQCTMLSKQNEAEKQTELKEEPQCDNVSENVIVKT